MKSITYWVIFLNLIIFNNLSWAKLANKIEIIKSKHQSHDIKKIDNNIFLVNCDTYSRSQKKILKTNIKKSFKQGIHCLSKLGKRWESDATRLKSILSYKNSDPYVIRCQIYPQENIGINLTTNKKIQMLDTTYVYALAQAFMPTNSTYPGFIISKRILPNLMQKDSVENRNSVLFHELIHSLGYSHLDTPKNFEPDYDIVDTMESCCFPKDPLNESQRSCEILKKYSQE